MDSRKLRNRIYKLLFTIFFTPIILSGCKKDYALEVYTNWKYVNINDYEPTEYKYVQGYLNNNRIPVYEFSKRSKILKNLKKYLEDELITLEKIIEFNIIDGDRFKRTLDKDNEYFYKGELSEDKPDGIGILYKEINWNDTRILLALYVGEFKDGYQNGYGIQFYEPSDTDLFSLGEICKDEFQKNLKKKLNFMEYNGEFKKGRYSGLGIYYSYPYPYEKFIQENDKDLFCFRQSKQDFNIYIGKWDYGKQDGTFKVYNNEHLIYNGGMKAGELDGKGTWYYTGSDIIKYRGQFINGSYSGKGTLYDENGIIKYEGEFSHGDIK